METTDATARAGTPVRLTSRLCMTHDAHAMERRGQICRSDQNLLRDRQTRVIARLRAILPAHRKQLLMEERCLDGVGRLSEDPERVFRLRQEESGGDGRREVCRHARLVAALLLS